MAEDYFEFQGFEFMFLTLRYETNYVQSKNGTFGGASALSINWIQDE